MKQYDVLKKYSSPLIEAQRSQDRHNPNIRYVTLKNDKWELSVTYTRNKITRIEIETDVFSMCNDTNGGRKICYYSPKGSDLRKMGISGILINDYKHDDNMKKLCSMSKRMKRALKLKGEELGGISFQSVENYNSKNAKWLRKHDLFDLVIEAKELFDCLSELLMGNTIYTLQLINLMEKGSLYKDEKDRNEHLGSTKRLKERVKEIETEIEEKQAQLQTIQENMKEIARQVKNDQSILDSFEGVGARGLVPKFEIIDGVIVEHTGQFMVGSSFYMNYEAMEFVDIEALRMYDLNGNILYSNCASEEEAIKKIKELEEKGKKAVIGPAAPYRNFRTGEIILNEEQSGVGVYLEQEKSKELAYFIDQLNKDKHSLPMTNQSALERFSSPIIQKPNETNLGNRKIINFQNLMYKLSVEYCDNIVTGFRAETDKVEIYDNEQERRYYIFYSRKLRTI